MAFSISGYILEKPRVGTANNTYTATPDNRITDWTAWNAAYPATEINPNDDYLVLVTTEGNVTTSRFGWTKNETVRRFDFMGRTQRYDLLKGTSPDAVGTVGLDSNTNRLKISPPVSDDLIHYPLRVSVTAPGDSGITLRPTVVPDEAHFSDPGSGYIQIAEDTGTINWHPADLTYYAGRSVACQRQGFQTNSSGLLGVPSDVLLLSPIPASGQVPQIRLGFDLPLTAIERANETAFSSDPAPGTVEWAANTGRLKLNSAATKAVYYDGVLMQTGLAIPTRSLGTVATPSALWPLPSEGGDVVFVATSGTQRKQFGTTIFVDSFTTVDRGSVQIRRSDGALAFSVADAAVYGTWTLTAYVCDLPIEHGVSLRLFRCPVNPDASNPDIPDFRLIYPAEKETLTGSVVGAPFVFLPATPLETYPMQVYVTQGTGSYTSDDFPNLETYSVLAPRTYGYILDYTEGQLKFAQRRLQYVIDRALPGSSAQLPDTYIQTTGLLLELETLIPGTWATLDLTSDAFIEPLSGVVFFTRTTGTLRASGTNGSITGTTFTDPTKDFTTFAQPGDLVVITSETSPGTVKGVYTISLIMSTVSVRLDVEGFDSGPLTYEVRRGTEILADRYFQEAVLQDPNTKVERILPLGTITNSPRLTVPTAWVSKFRIRYGRSPFSTTPVLVTTFSSPSAIPAGSLEVNAAGELNFAQDDVDTGETVYWARSLTPGVDYKLTAPLGFFEFTDRFMSDEEGRVEYVSVNTDTGETTSVVEPMTFLIRKELAQPRTVVTDTVLFNPSGRNIAPDPAPAVFRGGRPQTTSQYSLDLLTSTCTFLPDLHVDGLLPHGNKVAPDESIYIDYYVLGAVGGEKTITVLQPPMSVVTVVFDEDASSFQLAGDWTATFKPDYLLLIETSEVHFIESVTYSGGVTTVTLNPNDTFQAKWTSPKLFMPSGATPISTYFVPEIHTFEASPRGVNKLKFTGDLRDFYQKGVVIRFDYATGQVSYAIVQGAKYDETLDVTELTLGTNLLRQCTASSVTLRRTVRPILEATATTAKTKMDPVAPIAPQAVQSVLVYSRVEGERGIILSTDTSPRYSMDTTGQVTFESPLSPKQSWNIIYTGYNTIEEGRRLRATYTSIITPDDSNGLLGQGVLMDYSLASPDTFYYRVVKMTDYQAELVADYTKEAKNSVPSSGPMLSNVGATQLQDQGSPSVYYPEGDYANQDFVGRIVLKWYNDAVNLLEDVLQNMDGRIVGSQDGRIRFDGNADNPKRPTNPTLPLDWSTVTNQIDDLIKVSDSPYSISFAFPNFSMTALGTYLHAYEASTWSRFYPTWRRRYGVVAPGVETGDPVMDTGSKGITGVYNLRTRLAWAVTTYPTAAGAASLTVDNAQGSADNVRPPFKVGMEIVVQARDGTILIAESDHVSVVGVAATSLTLSGTLPTAAAVGTTVYRSTQCPFGAGTADAIATYLAGRDFAFNGETGQILYVKPFPPFDGSLTPPVPAELQAKPLPAGATLSCEVTLNNQLTAPEKIPALYGGTTDDDGEILFPVLSPSPGCELGAGYLGNDPNYVQDVRDVTTSEVTRTGSLDVTRTIITVTAPLPVTPKVYDLVRILDGLNGPSDFYEVVSATPTTITVGLPFLHADTGFTVEVVAPSSLVTGSGTITLTDTLTDLAATFQTAGVQPGHTLVITTGASAGRRLQVTQVVSQTVLRFSTAATNGVVTSYRVINPLASFGSHAGSGTALDTLVGANTGLLGVILTNTTPMLSENGALEAFIDLVFTYVGAGTGGMSGTTLTDPGATFETSGVSSGDVVYIRTGGNAGFYEVASVTSETVLEVTTAFPAASGAYQVGSIFGVRIETLQLLMAVLLANDAFVATAQAFEVLLTTSVPVVTTAGLIDPTAFARATLADDLDARDTATLARVAALTNPSGPMATIVSVLSSGDRLYDRRYTWIDSRINLMNGTRVRWARAILERSRLLAESLSAMTKLLAIT